MQIDHKEMSRVVAIWLKKMRGVPLVITECASRRIIGESPDVIGWKHHDSFLIECKVTRDDFLVDRNKPFRKNPSLGMGNYRYYACSGKSNLIKIEELPKKWGLLHVNSRNVQVVVEASRFDNVGGNEFPLVLSILLRLSKTEYFTQANISPKSIEGRKQRQALRTVKDEPEDVEDEEEDTDNELGGVIVPDSILG